MNVYEPGDPTKENPSFFTREGIDAIRNRDFLSLCRGHDGKAAYCEVEATILYLAACLGLIPPGCDNWKDVVYDNNPVTNLLVDILGRMNEIQLLRYDPEKGWYALPPMSRLLVVRPDPEDKDEKRRARASELQSSRLLWPDDVSFSLESDQQMYYIEEAPLGQMEVHRWSFDSTSVTRWRFELSPLWEDPNAGGAKQKKERPNGR